MADDIFVWRSPNGRETPQRRIPDADRVVGGPKYIWVKESDDEKVTLPVGVPPGMEARVADPAVPLVIVEGTRQYLAAGEASLDPAAKEVRAVVGIAGVWCWMQGDAPLADWADIPLAGRDIVIAFDADMATNRQVWDAAEHFQKFLTVEAGADSVKFILLSGKKDGVDDILRRAADPVATMDRLVKSATARMPRQPAKNHPNPLFDAKRGLRAVKCYQALRAKHPMAVTIEDSIACYVGGVYLNGNSKVFTESLVELLGEDYRSSHQETMEKLTLGLLKTSGEIIEDRPDRLLVNVRNGLVDPLTGVLHPHDPEFRTLSQIGIDYDPEAECPNFLAWIEERLPGQRDALMEAMGLALDPTSTPQKAIFLFGPSRSGKSTVLRLLVAVIGARDTSSVTLHQLSDDRFAAANLYGKRLNVAADISSAEVRDLSAFKMMTGEDPVQANRKYGMQFAFTNRALFAFSANDIPQVGEGSDAYLARIMPFHFAQSFKGEEDPEVEKALMAELPGILRLMVEGLGRFVRRGRRYPEPDSGTMRQFAERTDKVLMFINERTAACERPQGTDRAAMYAVFKQWCEANGTAPLGRNKFFDRMRQHGVPEFMPGGGGSRRFERVVVDPEKASDVADVAVVAVLERPALGVRSDETDGSVNPGPNSGKTATTATDEGNTPLTSTNSVSGTATPVSETATETATPTLETATGATAPLAGTATPLVFDLETGSVDRLHLHEPGYVRIAAIPGSVGPSVIEVVRNHPGPIAAHNGFGFDFHALGLDITASGHRLVDTKVLAVLRDPPPFGFDGRKVLKWTSLENCAARLGLPGKSDDINRLAKKHGGFDAIPVDDPEYLDYCASDVAATEPLVGTLTAYERREMEVMARLAGPITGTGFRIDTALVEAKVAENAAVMARGRDWLVETHGVPTLKKDGKPAANLLATDDGKRAVAAAFAAEGIDLPLTATGLPSIKKEHMAEIIDWPSATPGAVRLAEVCGSIVGLRTVYQTVATHLVGDRVHPTVFPAQRSGRFSVLDPGLTVMGKRKGKHVERAMFLPDEGDVLIAFDLDQIDARAVAAHCQDPAYMGLFDTGTNPETGKRWDSHAEIAHMVWGDRSRREEAKAIGHGWNYGMGLAKLAETTGLDMDTVAQFDRAMREKFPRLVEWKDEVRDIARMGQPLDNGFGRMMLAEPGREHTQAPALMGQGTARDLMAEAVLRLPLEIARMLRAFIHDEVVLSVPAGIAADVERAVLDAFTFDWAPSPEMRPITVTAGASAHGATWADCYRK